MGRGGEVSDYLGNFYILFVVGGLCLGVRLWRSFSIERIVLFLVLCYLFCIRYLILYLDF